MSNKRFFYFTLGVLSVVSLGAVTNQLVANGLGLSDTGIIFPDGTVQTTAFADGTFSIPVGALLLGGSASINSDTRVHLAASGNSLFSANIVIPNDHKAGTNIFVDVFVHNPNANGACQAKITRNFGRRFRAGSAAQQFGVFGFAAIYPAFGAGDQTITHQWRFTTDTGAGDALTFGWFRAGDNAADNCGAVELVGINVRYQRG